MTKRIRGLILVVVVVSLYVGSGVTAASAQDAQASKAKAAARDLGPGSRVRVFLQDKTKIFGYIQRIDENELAVFDKRTRTVRTVRYADIRKLTDRKASKGVAILGTAGFLLGMGVLVAVGWGDK